MPETAPARTEVPRIEVIVRRASMIAIGVKGVELATADGRALPEAGPGAHIDLWLPGGVRQYSVIEAAADRSSYRIAVLRAPDSRGGSAHIVDRLAEGDRLRISGPRNNFALEEGHGDYILVAGGIGITPILPMARRLAALGKTVSLHYLARSRGHAALLEELEGGGLKPVLRAHFGDERGRVDLRALLGTPRAGTQIYVCGPGRLIDAVLEAGATWPAGAVRFERFAAKAPTAGTARSFEVELARSGKVLTVAPEQSILDALTRERVRVDSICREGVCGSCAVTLLSGCADHRDAVQSDEEKAENQTLYVCVSRARSGRLVLDL